MLDPQNALLSTFLRERLPRFEAGEAAAWAEASRALDLAGESDAELRAAVADQDAAGLCAVLDQWASGERHLPASDRTVLKRAMKSFRKRLKLTRLDDESGLGGSPMSGGAHSSIVGVAPPSHYASDVWVELVRQGRLRAGGQGTYELPPE